MPQNSAALSAAGLVNYTSAGTGAVATCTVSSGAVQNTVIVTAGGRVLTVVGRGGDFAEAIARAYAGVFQISFKGMHYRHDIGRRALESEV